MYRIKNKKDLNGNKYYLIQKKFFVFWVTVLEYGKYEHALKELTKLNGE